MADFLLFKKAVKLIENKDHLTIDGLNQIVNLKASINLGLSDMLKSEFPNHIPVIRPIIEGSENLDPWWVLLMRKVVLMFILESRLVTA